MRIHFLQHVEFEGPALINNWALDNQFLVSSTHFYRDNYSLPDLNDFDLLVILGGPMNVYETDKYRWLNDEKRLIKRAIDAQKKVLGICLGAQLIADVLGANVTPMNHKEIGWYPINFSRHSSLSGLLSKIPSTLRVLHWHGDSFSIPENAIPLGQSAACSTQGFLFSPHVLALQFHLEMDEQAVRSIMAQCADELEVNSGSDRHIQSKTEIITTSTYTPLSSHLFTLLNNWLTLS